MVPAARCCWRELPAALGHLDPHRGQYEKPMPLLSACGAAVLYRSRAFLLSGALDGDFFAYLDDLALCPSCQPAWLSRGLRPSRSTSPPGKCDIRTAVASLRDRIHHPQSVFRALEGLFIGCVSAPAAAHCVLSALVPVCRQARQVERVSARYSWRDSPQKTLETEAS